MRELPSGTVTLLFTDIEGSTRLLHELGDRYGEVLAEHRRVLREAFARENGVEVDTQGDAFFIAFGEASDAVAAAKAAQLALDAGPVRVRIGIHTGEPDLGEEGYVGVDVHRGARIAAAGHGGQVLLSRATRDLLHNTVELVDLGEHRLKDLPEPEWLFQLGVEEFPPLKSLNNTNLPAAANALVGRGRELEELTAFLRRNEVRLLTLTGAGGTGKTRLALEVAAELVGEYPNGVFFVPLAPISDPSLVVPTIAQTLGVKEQAGEPLDRALSRELESKTMLLFVDNFEQVVGAAPDVAKLLERAPQLNVLATSREPLHLGAELEYAVPPLPDSEAVGLFRARAANAEPPEAVAEICRRLDGLPLAIELAAARTKVLPPGKLLERLEQRLPLLVGKRRDVPARQQTLRATIAWSYDLLSSEEQRLFARLAAFAGGFTLEAAEEICGAELDTVSSLVDKSLVRLSGDRFWMLETIREFAAERLGESGKPREWQLRHAEFFLALAEAAEPEFMGARQLEWLQRLEVEHDNLRMAIGFLRQTADAVRELRLVGSLWRFWYLRGFFGEGRRRLEDALAAGEGQSAALREKILYGAAVLAHRQGDYERAATLAEKRLTLAEQLGDTHLLASALLGVGLMESVRSNYERGRATVERSADLARQTGQKEILAMALTNLGGTAQVQGDYERAGARFEEALVLFRELSDTHGIGATLANLGSLAHEQGRREDARALLSEGLKVAREFGDKEVIAWCFEDLAAVAAGEIEAERAARLLGALEVLREDTGAAPQPTEREVHERTMTFLGAELDDEALARAWDEGRSLTLEQATDYALERSGP
jgi:predicted ATPase